MLEIISLVISCIAILISIYSLTQVQRSEYVKLYRKLKQLDGLILTLYRERKTKEEREKLKEGILTSEEALELKKKLLGGK
jgi:MoaA/NifB/PqqE/SkfB family radical SAM enzyme